METPELNNLPERIASLSPERLALLKLQVKKKGLDASRTQILARKKGSTSLSLSFAQERLWFLDQLEPGISTYNIPYAMRITGSLDVTALEQGLNEIVRRHEILRTTFPTVEGRPVQSIAPSLALILPMIDLRELPKAERETEELRWVSKESRHPFNLSQGPLLRAMLLRLNEEEHVLLLTIHHIVFDGWSTNIFTRELAALYGAFSAGKPPPLPEPQIQYADFACWQREWLQGDVLAQQLSYWKQQLNGAPFALQLPTDQPRPAVQTFDGAQRLLVLPEAVTEALQTLSRQEGVTLFMTLLAAFLILLQRYTGQDDLIVGSPIANRTQAEIEGVIGCFVNTLVLRTDLAGNPTFRELLARVREVTLGAYAHPDLPFERLVEELQPERNLSRPPMFDVMINFNNSPRTPLKLPGLTISDLHIAESVSKFPMTLYLEVQERELSLRLVYQLALFSSERIACMLNQFQHLLEQIVATPDRPIESYSLVIPQSLHLLPDPHVLLPEPQYELITDLFTSWVRHSPEQPAVCQSNGTWTYRELAESGEAIARALLAQRLESGDVVAVMGQQSFGLVASMMAVFLSGGVLLPIDRNLPTQRQQLMLREAGAKHVLYIGDWRPDDKWVQELPAPGVLQVDPGKGWVVKQGIAPRAEAAPLPALGANAAAYIFFTSGTTGIPKGVLGCHKGLSHFLTWQRKTFAVGQHDRCAQLTGLSFDVVLRDVFLPLTSGATLCLPERPEGLGPEQILLWLERERISLLHTVPTLAQSWLAKIPPGVSLRSLRWVFFAGEPLTEALVRRWREVFAEAGGIANLYGPTETSLAKCFYIVEPTIAPGVQPVGRALPETQALVLTQSNELCGIGELGEIVLRTPFRSLGYINAPQDNRKRFIRNPFRDDEADVLYRTGDRGRYRLDGSLEITGRLDHQVKIRGVRVEPDEVMAILQQHPAVRSCAVVAQKDEQAPNSLVAYIAISEQEPVTSSELRSYLSRQLPSPMVPSSFVLLEALPLTLNGKVDRLALPAPAQVRGEAEEPFVAPRTPIEEVLAGIWAEVLGLQRVGVFDNFFEIGGHSLLATQVVARVRDAFQIELPLRSLFETPTVAALALSLRKDALEEPSTQAIAPRQQTTPCPLSYAQQRLWFLEQLTPGTSAYNLAFTLRLEGALNVLALERSLNELVQRHAILRTTFASQDGLPVQVIAPALAVRLPLVDLRQVPVPEREGRAVQKAHEEMEHPFDLTQGPLLRAILLQIGEEEYLFLLNLHHIIFDSWSSGVFMRELAILYAAFATGKSPALPSPPIQYADFAVWQRMWLQGDVLETQLAYWRRQLEAAPKRLELPTDHPRPAMQTFCGGQQRFVLSRDLVDALKVLSRRRGVTLFMTLLAAFNVLLYRYSGQEDIVVGSPIANRNRLEIEGLIGFFVNTLVLRTDLSGNPPFGDLLRQVREVALGAYAHQDLPFEKLVEELQPERNLSHNPLFQVMFALQNIGNAALELPGLRLRPVVVESETTKFDLSLSLEDNGQELAGSVEYSTDLFEATTISRLVGHYQRLLEGIVADPQQRIAELPLLTEAEYRQVVLEWNQARRDYPQEQCIHQLFEGQVERTPERVAAVCAGERLTYRELNRRADQLAHHLRYMGVGPDVLVSLLAERGTNLLTAILAVFKAGGAYLPLDPFHPAARLRQVLERSASKLVLAGETFASTLSQALMGIPSSVRPQAFYLEDLLGRGEAEGDLPIRNSPHQLAYVIYTSGSTGEPKGVMIEHAGMLNHLHEIIATLHLAETDIVAQTASQCFDISVWQFLAALLVGGQVHIFTDAVTHDPMELLAQVALNRVSVFETVPSSLQAMLEGIELAGAPRPDLTALRWLIPTGEALTPQLCRRWLSLYPQPPLLNAYGPAECSDDVTFYPISLPPVAPAPHLPVGRPLANMRLYVLDTRISPVPVGVIGELYVGGIGVGRGYLGDPMHTAEAFIPDPFSNEPGARLYKTGDLARYLPDGTIEYVGRIDYQVKVRGFRIELGEIEAVLGQHSFVQEAVVLAREDTPGDKRLVAYVVPHRGQAPASSELRTFLREKLPEYMVPSSFVLLEALPLTPNGKVDRRALPIPERTESSVNSYVAPRNRHEQTIVAIWQKLLGIEQVGIHDNFFELGGHSLLATQLISRLRNAFQVELPLRSLFQRPTVAELAIEVAQKQMEQVGSETLTQMLAEIKQLSMEELRAMLASEGRGTRKVSSNE